MWFTIFDVTVVTRRDRVHGVRRRRKPRRRDWCTADRCDSAQLRMSVQRSVCGTRKSTLISALHLLIRLLQAKQRFVGHLTVLSSAVAVRSHPTVLRIPHNSTPQLYQGTVRAGFNQQHIATRQGAASAVPLLCITQQSTGIPLDKFATSRAGSRILRPRPSTVPTCSTSRVSHHPDLPSPPLSTSWPGA